MIDVLTTPGLNHRMGNSVVPMEFYWLPASLWQVSSTLSGVNLLKLRGFRGRNILSLLLRNDGFFPASSSYWDSWQLCEVAWTKTSCSQSETEVDPTADRSWTVLGFCSKSRGKKWSRTLTGYRGNTCLNAVKRVCFSYFLSSVISWRGLSQRASGAPPWWAGSGSPIWFQTPGQTQWRDYNSRVAWERLGNS